MFTLGAAFSAGAGDTVATLAEGTTAVPSTDAIAAADALATGAPNETQPALAPLPEAGPEEIVTAADPLAEQEVVSELAPAPVAPASEPAGPQALESVSAEPAPTAQTPATPKARPQPRLRPKTRAKWRARAEPVLRARTRPRQLSSELEPEARVPGVDATIWLHRSMPDPTPPSKRLAPAFAHRLRTVARASQVDWALMLGLLRAEGRTGAAPATASELRALASQLSKRRGEDARNMAGALVADSERADRAVALANYHRAVGLRALVRGLEWAKPRLVERLLRDDRVATYEGGRFDIASGRVDVRVLVLVAYLAETYGEVTVSSLKTGHRLYSRPGVISAHVYGLAVDISALGGISIAGNQEPGGLTEHAVRNILLLPAGLMPSQVISLLGLGGPSFPLGDHGDHIHVGY